MVGRKGRQVVVAGGGRFLSQASTVPTQGQRHRGQVGQAQNKCVGWGKVFWAGRRRDRGRRRRRR